MSLVTSLGIGVLLLWAMASAAYAFRLPGLHTALKRINWFRAFAHWTMFSAGPDSTRRPGTYEIEMRECPADGRPGAWRTVASGHPWAWHGFLAHPPRHRAARIQSLGQRIDHGVMPATTPEAREELQRTAALIAECFGAAGARPGRGPEFRLIKRFGPGSGTPERVVWQFVAENHVTGR